MRGRSLHLLSLISLSATLWGCKAVGPDYQPPVTPVPDSWARAIQGERSSAQTGAQRWWRQFKDPDLNRLIAMAKDNNPDLKRAQARIHQAWHQCRIIEASLFTHNDLYARNSNGLGSFNTSGVKWDFRSSINDLAQVDMGWEMDIFGGIRRQTESVNADYEASIEGWRDFHVLITAQVALDYIALRTFDARLRSAREGLTMYQEIAGMAKVRHQEGVGAEVDVLEASARLKTQEALVPALENERGFILSNLSVLIGTYPQQAAAALKPEAPIPVPPTHLATGVPADLLRSRPDIRRAERKLQAQSARIGIATAELYPRLSLSGAITYEHNVIQKSIVTLFRRDLGLGPTLRWRLLHHCADQARVKEMEAGMEIELAAYEEVVLRAVAEVEESMGACHFEGLRFERLTAATSDYRKTAELLTDSYRAGLVDLRRLLNARQDALNTADEAAATRGRLAAHTVKLFKALGGGPLPTPKGMEAQMPEAGSPPPPTRPPLSKSSTQIRRSLSRGAQAIP